jgi:hypothetical protein
MPERIQLSRRKGWRKPENTVVVARPSKWGNPFRLNTPEGLACEPGAMTGELWEYEDRISAAGQRHDFFHPGVHVTRCEIRYLTAAEAVALYRELLTGEHKHLRDHMNVRPGLFVSSTRTYLTASDAVTELAGKNLACWCPLDQPCHADVLLELANGEATS